MNILMITGSPHKEGTSAKLAKEFEKGTKKNGHKVRIIQAAFEDLHPCKACDYCIGHGGVCIQKDAMVGIQKEIFEADMVVIVTPLYYFGMSAQIKMVLDRFYAFNDRLMSTQKKSVLLAACGDEEEWVANALELHFKTVCQYLNWKIEGMLIAKGVHTAEDIDRTDYLNEAKNLGASL